MNYETVPRDPKGMLLNTCTVVIRVILHLQHIKQCDRLIVKLHTRLRLYIKV